MDRCVFLCYTLFETNIRFNTNIVILTMKRRVTYPC